MPQAKNSEPSPQPPSPSEVTPGLTDPGKRRGAPKGGWPSQIAKRTQKKLEILSDAAPAKPEHAFALEHEGRNLWRVVLYTIEGKEITKREYVSPGDLKGNALAKLRYHVYQLWFNERFPEANPGVMPSQPTTHG